ncbi:pumilio homology domain family member 6 [Coccidioides immitis RS]|uniref:Pumilio homology domain family member 6 n=3 Tax=Coccidioides immitis TaxID=5501 RepID=A0A0D8JVF7_COCIM|nr:pumilio homology domain family member 6 [Coccidioides immitis RS]KJF61292.1 pumilio homology domain family member 6 [Coccidioides immitis RS]KMP08537.1 pumilio domain-containing protein [Coccidioides immitis RMSCC 2394]KMU72985.1 pumilio domain-containing protein [Coccidioides immitis RMSCC 3703]
MSGIKRAGQCTQDNARKRSKLKKLSPTPHDRQLNEAKQAKTQAVSKPFDSDTQSLSPNSQSGAPGEEVQHQNGGTLIDGSNRPLIAPLKAASPGRRGQAMSNDINIKQKLLARQRKLAKPNSDLIVRTKKIWERLRLKSHVTREEREQLVTELYSIITGRVNEFVFKHDAVRVIQTALKYGTAKQRKAIAVELKGTYRELAESKYGKFLLAKLVVHGNSEIRNMIIPEFYGNVGKLMRHPEASWILDDIYRITATSIQRSMLLREWYGPEFALFKTDAAAQLTAQLSQILEETPEKRNPIMQHLFGSINQFIQKKTTGFTMLHDAMLQYFLNAKPGSAEATEFMELLKGDEDGSLVKNLAFTKSGSRLMCLVLAYSNAKDRKSLLRIYRGMISMLVEDVHARTIILVAYEVIDDTKLTAKLIFPELFGESFPEAERHDYLLRQVNDVSHRIPLLYLFGGEKLSWLLGSVDEEILEEVCRIRSWTSKKDPTVRRNELINAASLPMLHFIASTAESLVATSSGCRCITEVLFSAHGDKKPALKAVAATVRSKPENMGTPSAGRMLKALVQGPNPFVVVALVEASDFGRRGELIDTLRCHMQTLRALASKCPQVDGNNGFQGNSAAAKLLLDLINPDSTSIAEPVAENTP